MTKPTTIDAITGGILNFHLLKAKNAIIDILPTSHN